MSTLPAPEKALRKEVREEILTLPAYAAPEQHYRSTQLAVRQRPLKVTGLSVWIDLLPGGLHRAGVSVRILANADLSTCYNWKI